MSHLLKNKLGMKCNKRVIIIYHLSFISGVARMAPEIG